MLPCVARLTYSKHNQYNHPATNSDIQQHNRYTTSNQKGIIILLKYHYMPANNYCSVLCLALANIKSNM